MATPRTLDKNMARSMAYAAIAAHGANAKPQIMRDAQWQKMLNTVDPMHLLDEAERNTRAHALMKSKMLAMSVKSAEVRRNKVSQRASVYAIQNTVSKEKRA